MKALITTFWFFLTTLAYGQSLSLENPTYRSNDIEYTLIEADEFFTTIHFKKYNEGSLIETGYYRNNKPHGTWVLYDSEGNRISAMKFNDGNRISMEMNQNGRRVTILYLDNKPTEVTYYIATN